MIGVLILLLVQPHSGAPVPSGAVLDGHERRGAVIAYAHGAAAAGPESCARACNANEDCRAWTWRIAFPEKPARCDIHSVAHTPSRNPGAVTGLSARLAAEIEAASERAPSAREKRALRAAEGKLPRPEDAPG